MRDALVSEKDAEVLISPQMSAEGAQRLAEVGEASPAYLAETAFVAMVVAECASGSRLGGLLRREIRRLKGARHA